MSPTIFREGGFRFFFFSREERRIHVHALCANGVAKFWLEPDVELAQNYGLNNSELKAAATLVKEHHDEISRAWTRHFAS